MRPTLPHSDRRSRQLAGGYAPVRRPWVRNRVFSLLPGGLALIAGTGTVGFAKSERDAAAVALMLVTWAALIVVFVWLFHPPEFMKPRWLREVESGRAPEPSVLGAALGAAGPGRVRRIYLPPPVYWILWAAIGAFFALWLVFDWSWSWVVGLGFGVSTLAASTPRKERGLR